MKITVTRIIFTHTFPQEQNLKFSSMGGGGSYVFKLREHNMFKSGPDMLLWN